MNAPKAVYTLGELATLVGIERRKLRRLLCSNGVKIGKSGRKDVVFLNALKTSLPDLWDSILDRQAVGRDEP